MNANNTKASTENCGPLSRVVLNWVECMERIVKKAKQPGFTVADWAPLTDLVAVKEFERVGCFLEVMNWQMNEP